MLEDSKSFFRRFQGGVDVAVAAGRSAPEKALGIRDGFHRFFRETLGRAVPVTLHHIRLDVADLPMSDQETLDLARARSLEADQQSSGHAFAVGSEGGLSTQSSGDETRYFVCNWTVIRGLEDEAWGVSGGLQLPQRLIDGVDGVDIPFAMPGTRRSGGMAASLTGGVETARTAASLATFNALASLLYGRLGVQPRS